MDEFLEEFFKTVYDKKKQAHESNYCKYDDQGLAAFTSSLYLAGLVSTLAASPITRNYGRRASIVCGGISFLVGAALNAGAVNLPMLLAGRILLGVGIGFGNQVRQTKHIVLVRPRRFTRTEKTDTSSELLYKNIFTGLKSLVFSGSCTRRT